MRKHILFLILWMPIFLLAQEAPKKIGLALSGGGAKGIAHIGVLRVLEDAGIRPDYITGTSIGSVMGGLYAIGYSVDEMERLALELDWNYYFNDELKRTDLPIEERYNSDRYQLKLGLENGSVQLPKGFIQGQKMGLLLSKLTFPAHGIHDFDQFKIPFRCVATDAETGDAVVLKSGSLAKAMRASMSLPSIFEPMELNDKLLIDGGVVRNLPVIEALDMGADIVIAVDITSPLYKKEELVSLVQVLEQTSSYKLAESVAIQKQLADVVISPNIEGIGTLDFEKGDTLLHLGRQAAEKMLPELYSLINRRDSLVADYVAVPTICKVCNVQMRGIEEKKQNTVTKRLQMRTTKEYELTEIENRIKQLFGSQFFKDAYYELIPAEEGYELKIDATEKSGEYLRLSANYDSDLKAALLLNATFRNRLLKGSKLSVDFKLSENPLLLADYQVYTSTQPNFGIHLQGKFNHFPLDFYDFEGGVEEITGMYHYHAGLELFSSFRNSSLLSYGIGLERYAQRENLFIGDEEALGTNQYFAFLGYLWDTYDRQQYPREGMYFSLQGKQELGSSIRFPLGQEENLLASFRRSAQLDFSMILPVGDRLAVQWYNHAGLVEFRESDLPNNFLNLFYLGRSIPEESSHVEFFGLDYMELPVSSYWLSGLRMRAEVQKNVFGSLLVNYGQYKADTYQRIVEEEIELIPAESDNILGLGLELGFVSALGPGRFSAEYNLNESRVNFALHLGYFF